MKTLCVALVLVVLLATPVMAAPDCPACEWALKQEWRDADTESLYDAGRCVIWQVSVKAGTRVLLFERDGCVDGYCVSGIGTTQGRAWEDGPRHDISSVSWCVACPPTAVTLADVDGSGPWYVWLGALAIVALVTFAAGVIIGEAREAEREQMRQRMDTATGALRGEVR